MAENNTAEITWKFETNYLQLRFDFSKEKKSFYYDLNVSSIFNKYCMTLVWETSIINW